MFLIVLFFVNTLLTITTSFASWHNTILSLACASLAAWFTWKLVTGEETHTLIAVIGGALILGGVFFTLVFLAPMFIAKDTSQGPMIGIFIAAPIGVILGAIGGYVYASKRKVKMED